MKDSLLLLLLIRALIQSAIPINDTKTILLQLSRIFPLLFRVVMQLFGINLVSSSSCAHSLAAVLRLDLPPSNVTHVPHTPQGQRVCVHPFRVLQSYC